MRLPENATLVSQTAVARLGEEGLDLPEVEGQALRLIAPSYRGWPWSTTSAMFFRRDALNLICGADGLPGIRIGTDHYLAQTINLLCGSIIIDRQLIGYRLHGANGFNKRAPLDGFICHNRADEQFETTSRVFQDDLIARFAFFSDFIDSGDRIFDICRMIDLPEGEAGTSRLARLLRERRAQLAPIVGDAVLTRWMAEAADRRIGPGAPRGGWDDARDHDHATRLSRDSIHAIAMEVWFERQRWGVPYKLGRWLRQLLPAPDRARRVASPTYPSRRSPG